MAVSNLILNLRVWYWHLQIDRDRWWAPRITFNDYRWELGERSPWIELC